jgi:serine/threonine-protein kinase
MHDADTPVILNGFGLHALLAHRARTDRNRIDVMDVSYVAPEQIGGARIDGRADQYALACALYHCVAGRPPFVRDTPAALFGAHLFNQARVPPGRDGEHALGSAVATGMAKGPNDRHPSCTALMRATGVRAGVRVMARTGGSAAPMQRPRRRSRRRSRRRRHRWRLPIAWPVAAMLVLAGIVCTLLLAAALRANDDRRDAESRVGEPGVVRLQPGAPPQTS